MRPAGDFHWSVIKLHATLAAVQKILTCCHRQSKIIRMMNAANIFWPVQQRPK